MRFALAAIFCAVFGVATANAAELLDVRFGPAADKTRVVFDLSSNTDVRISGAATGTGQIFVDFANLEAKSRTQRGQGAVGTFEIVNRTGAQKRVVLNLKSYAAIADAFMIPPSAKVKKYRYVIDLKYADRDGFEKSLPETFPDLTAVIEQATAEPDNSPVYVPPTPRQKEVRAPVARRVVVIDPGHGGADPGAQGQSGTLEKNVTLSAALKLAEVLEKRAGYDVVFTRATDKKIRPDARETLARKAGADLFISLHADAIAQKAVRGASVYTLSEQGSARSASIAKSQGDYHIYNLDLEEFDQNVSSILLDKAQEYTGSASSRFAELLIDRLSGKTPMLNRSHRKADLRVLLAPDVPAVLLEMAFISNAKDEANLNSEVWRTRTMTAVADAIEEYFSEQSTARHAANNAG